MKNSYGLPEDDLEKIRNRDKVCVYCHKKLSRQYAIKDWPTIEHLNYLPPWNNPETVAICCWSCNSSRGNKPILKWFDSRYCVDKDINIKTVADVVKKYVLVNPDYM